MSSSKSASGGLPPTKEELQSLYRSNARQRTRAGLGVAISGAMAGGGLYYMAAPAGVAAYGLHKAGDAKEQLEDIMKQHGVKIRKRDKLSGMLVGSAEKLALSFFLLGHDEIAYLGTEYGLDQDIIDKHMEWVNEGSLLGDTNHIYNEIVDNIKEAHGVEPGVLATAIDVQGHAITGGVAAGQEYATNRVGHAGRILAVKANLTGASHQGDKKS